MPGMVFFPRSHIRGPGYFGAVRPARAFFVQGGRMSRPLAGAAARPRMAEKARG